MTDRKSYSDPSQGTGSSEQKGDRSPDRDREKNLGDKNIGSRHGDDSSKSGSTGSQQGGRSSDMERGR
jgi:hypothetical protein